MIRGSVSPEGVPVIPITVSGQRWAATIDTGFNGDLELPEALRPFLNPRYIGRTCFLLAAGQTAVEDTFLVNFPFDGEAVLAEATFTSAGEILIGTGLLGRHRLEIHFPNQTVSLEQAGEASLPAAPRDEAQAGDERAGPAEEQLPERRPPGRLMTVE